METLGTNLLLFGLGALAGVLLAGWIARRQIRRLEQGLDDLREMIGQLPSASEPVDIDLTPITTMIKTLEYRIAALPRPAPAAEAPEKPGQPRMVSAVLYGDKDNLQLISGIGPRLEKVLNDNGVYYYWQLAEWNQRDIEEIDERLGEFSGRITREDWVGQARRMLEGRSPSN